MRWLRKISLRFRSLLHKDAVERDLDEELRFHIERQVSENIAAGMLYQSTLIRTRVPNRAGRWT